MELNPFLPLSFISKLLPFVLTLVCFLVSCSEDPKPETKKTTLPPVVEKATVSTDHEFGKLDFPKVYLEELDQFQEFFKEQHETSFSHVPKKNWMSFTAGKDGVLTKILLFGKANYKISNHYGSAMRGFVRESNPESGAKLGEWELSRDQIVNQLAAQGLAENESGWITLHMRGEIPQIAGRTYFLVCQEIDDEKAWFGAFAFSEGNTYLPGRHWLHPDHDLVFRTYVGKTSDQIAKEQKVSSNFKPVLKQDNLGLSNSSISQPPPPKPMFAREEPLNDQVDYKPAVEPNPNELKPFGVSTEESVPAVKTDPNKQNGEDSTEKSGNKSLFNRLFKKSSDEK